MPVKSNEKPKRVLRLKQVQERIPLGATAIEDLEKAGIFPRRFKIGSHAAGWLESEIEEYIERRVALSRDGSTAA